MGHFEIRILAASKLYINYFEFMTCMKSSLIALLFKLELTWKLSLFWCLLFKKYLMSEIPIDQIFKTYKLASYFGFIVF